MTISELIEILKKIQEQEGDLPVYIDIEWGEFSLGEGEVAVNPASSLGGDPLPKRLTIG